jgi:hypothetical protein
MDAASCDAFVEFVLNSKANILNSSQRQGYEL